MRPEKSTIVADVKARLDQSPYAIIADYAGMQVTDFEGLRVTLDEAKAEIHVVKNSFIKRAFAELGLPDISASLVGQTVMVTGESDICAAAKALKNFHKDKGKLAMRTGVLDNALLSFEQLVVLADLPSKEVLRAQLLGVLLAPASKLVRTLNEPGASLARLLKAKAEKENQS